MFFSKALGIFSLAAAVSALSVSYDQGYDDAGRLMTAIACSDGPNGLITKYGWETQGAIPKFPNIGGWEGIEGWGSTNVRNFRRRSLVCHCHANIATQCGTCLQLTYNGKSINVLAIDHAGAGANIALEAMNVLTDNQATFLGRVEADVVQLDISACL